MGKFYQSIFLFAALCLMQMRVEGTHINGGEIIARRVDNVSLTYEITVIGYKNLDSTIEFAGGVLNLGDGEVINGPFSTTHEQIDNQIERTYFTVTHTFKGPSAAGYIISYQEDFRDDNIININSSVQTTFYVETKLVIDPFLGSNSTPVLINPPLLWGQAGKVYQSNPGAYDPDGDLLTYRIVDVQRARNTIVAGYRSPIHPDFYTEFDQGNAAGNGPPILNIDRFTGQLTWDAPSDDLIFNPDNCIRGASYTIAIAVDEWRNVRGNWYRLGYVVRDHMIRVDLCNDNLAPVLPSLPDTCVVVGDHYIKNITASNPDDDPLGYRADGEPLELQNNADYTVSETSMELNWTPACTEVRDEPYQIFFRATDNIFSGPAPASVSMLSIHVLGPEVHGINIQDEANAVNLSWDAYICPNADSMEIWRKEGSFEGERCDLIHPEDQEFQLIGKVPIQQLTFTDTSIPPGASSNDFTWHLKATFPGNSNDPEELFDVLTNIEDPLPGIRIYPNPTSGSVVVDPHRQVWGYQIHDLSGKVLLQSTIDPSGNIEGLQQWDDGLYILVLFDRNQQIVSRHRLVLRK